MNAILLIIDSLDYTRCQSSKVQLLPNIVRQAKNGIVCEKMYSQSPYTEAATIALYCGQNTLDNHGYIERFNNVEKTLMEVMKTEGYDTFYNSFQPQCFPSSLRRGIDSIRYNRGFDNYSLWSYRLEYYAERQKKGIIEEIDYRQIMRILSDNFCEWKKFLDDLMEIDESVDMIKHLNNKYDASSIKDLVVEEEKKYNNNPRKYILDILKEGKKHALFNIPYFEQIDYEISNTTAHYYNNEIRFFAKKIRVVNLIQNVIFNCDIWSAFIRSVKNRINGNKEAYVQETELIRNALLMGNNNKKYGDMCHSLKGQPSFNEHLKSFFKWLDARGNEEKPFFATIHVDDIHYPEMFFSYDSNELTLLKEELATVKDCLRKRKFYDKGTISLDLSLRYVDLKFDKMMKGIKERGLLEDTVVFVTADHGFSYSGYPIRNKFVNTFYLENFKIPFFVIGNNIKPLKETSLRSSVDIPPTICDILGVDAPPSFVGKSLLKNNEKDRIITIEYCGGGCPDINNKELMIAAFDEDYMVAGLVKLELGFSVSCITEIYDLKKDPLQKRNLVNKIDSINVEKYIDVIKKRVLTIADTNRRVIDSF